MLKNFYQQTEREEESRQQKIKNSGSYKFVEILINIYA